MKVTINYLPKPAPGYTPRRADTLYNVESVIDKGVGRVEIRSLFSDQRPTFDHVASVVVIPEKEETE
jgi:hypothetical protein